MTWHPVYPLAVYVALAAGCIAVVVAARRLAITPQIGSWLVLGLRLIVLWGLLVILLNPIDRRETQLPPRPASVAIAVDCSQSMLLGEPRSRLEQVKQTIQYANSSLPTSRRPRLALFRFGEHLAKVPSLVELAATDDATLLGPALERLPSRTEADPPRAVVICSDGAIKDADRLGELTQGYADMSLPIHTLLAGDDGLRGDVAITDLSVPSRVTSGDKAALRAAVSSRGFAGRRVVLSVRPAGREEMPPLATLPITLADGRQPCELVIDVNPDVGAMTLSLPALPGEATEENNTVPFRLTDRDRRLKVLYMEGSPGAEYRWLRDALQEDPDIRCLCLAVNDQYAARPRLQRVEDPYRGYPTTRDELFEFDVVICSDISQRAFTPEQIDWTVDLVAQRGGGFAMVGGHTSFGSGGWDRTPWEQLIPFDMSGRREYLAKTFSVDIPHNVHSHAIWKLLDDPEQNRLALESMPQFFGTNLIARAKPAATLLGETNVPMPQVGVMPVFACQPFARGRTFAMSTDTTVAWGRLFESQWGEGDNRYFRKFWRNVVRWLAENSLSNQRRLHVRTDKVIYSPGAPIQVVAEAYDEDLKLSTEYQLTARLVADDAQEEFEEDTVASDGGAPHLFTPLAPRHSGKDYSAELPAQLPQDQRDATRVTQPMQLVVTATKNDETLARVAVGLQLLNNSDEWLEPQARPELLEQLAKASGGNSIKGPAELTKLLGQFAPTPGETLYHTVPLWDQSPAWVLLVGLLGLEWTLRRTASWLR